MRVMMMATLLMMIPLGALAADALIGPDAWRALTQNKTLHYYKDGTLHGREYYRNERGDVVFRAPGGFCSEGRWSWADDRYCFSFEGELHCFRHVMRNGRIIAIEEQSGEEQTVEKITENEPLSCEESVGS